MKKLPTSLLKANPLKPTIPRNVIIMKIHIKVNMKSSHHKKPNHTYSFSQMYLTKTGSICNLLKIEMK